jgi:hypothetical protein
METLVKTDDRGRAAYNMGLAKVAVQCSADTFVVNQSLVLRINICGENRHLRQARNRSPHPIHKLKQPQKMIKLQVIFTASKQIKAYVS